MEELNDISYKKKMKIVFMIPFLVLIACMVFGFLFTVEAVPNSIFVVIGLVVYAFLSAGFIIYQHCFKITHNPLYIVIIESSLYLISLIAFLSIYDVYSYSMPLFAACLGLIRIVCYIADIVFDHQTKSRVIFYILGILLFIDISSLAFYFLTQPLSEISNLLGPLVGYMLFASSMIAMFINKSLKSHIIPEKDKSFRKILSKTRCLEIISGLLIAILVVATILPILEPDNIPSFGDALWYCFAIVTTIGFGDITAKTAIGRLISVLLGVYGIVIVALFTAAIVNYYNENKDNEEKKIQENPPESIDNKESKE